MLASGVLGSKPGDLDDATPMAELITGADYEELVRSVRAQPWNLMHVSLCMGFHGGSLAELNNLNSTFSASQNGP
jgi:hypothetical protein